MAAAPTQAQLPAVRAVSRCSGIAGNEIKRRGKWEFSGRYPHRLRPQAKAEGYPGDLPLSSAVSKEGLLGRVSLASLYLKKRAEKMTAQGILNFLMPR